MNWEDVLDQQVDVFRFWNTQIGQRYSKAFGESFYRKTQSNLLVDGMGRFDPERIAEIGRWSAYLADPIAVQEDVMTLVEAGCDTSDPERAFKPEKLIPEDLITPNGFVFLPRPIYVTDALGKQVGNRAFSWAPMASPNQEGQGVVIMMYSLSGDKDDYWDSELPTLHSPSQLVLSHLEPWWFYEEVPDRISAKDLTSHYAGRDIGILTESYLSPLRVFQVFNRLANQKIVQPTQMRPAREYRRRAERAGVTEDPYVTVIQLRRHKRPQDEDHEPQEVKWTHRWLVGHHWRNQWYPSLNMHRQIFITPYVKGPEHLELVIRDKRAFNFSR